MPDRFEAGGDDVVGLYLREIARHPMLSRAEEAAPSECIRTGNEASDRLAEECRRRCV